MLASPISGSEECLRVRLMCVLKMTGLGGTPYHCNAEVDERCSGGGGTEKLQGRDERD